LSCTLQKCQRTELLLPKEAYKSGGRALMLSCEPFVKAVPLHDSCSGDNHVRPKFSWRPNRCGTLRRHVGCSACPLSVCCWTGFWLCDVNVTRACSVSCNAMQNVRFNTVKIAFVSSSANCPFFPKSNAAFLLRQTFAVVPGKRPRYRRLSEMKLSS
jgi:hypothetical protein